MLEITDDVIIEEQEEKQVDDEKYVEIREPYGFIYITTNIVNGKRYLGQKTFDRKWKDYIGSGIAFNAAVKKYGKENFIRNIVFICYSVEELNQIEFELSVFLNVVESDNWYNMVYGGGTTSGIIVSEKTRKKLSEARRNNTILHPEYDAYHSQKMIEFHKKHPEAKENSSDRLKQLWQNSDFIIKMEQHREGYWSDENNHTKRREILKEIWKDPDVKEIRLRGLREWNAQSNNHDIRSELSKRNWDKPGYREAQILRNTGSGNPMYGVRRYGIDSTNFIPVYCIEMHRIFWGATQAENELHIKGSDIAQCCKGRRGHKSAGKYPVTGEKLQWKYVYDQASNDGTIIKGAITLGYITEEEVNNYLDSLRQKGNDINGTMEEE